MRGRNGFYWTRLALEAASHGEWCGFRDLATFIGVDIRTELDFRDFGHAAAEALQDAVAEMRGEYAQLEARRWWRRAGAAGLAGVGAVAIAVHLMGLPKRAVA